ncbi:uncharacterized protein PADG_03247 [Paracoccidioides brasiliensis Pb18]|uniref:CoA-binding domain-containing protein n=1 Tax=Paracoccidioides brasiliensis (strain Pb18) TaxID=502780 RepID=C1G7U2_PARBD|nr:uncharacterized protein PADG_03247 [Paracoccidioides brasiliensis Pb18]EEH47149.1 hypothetical protein PADG_03247 [Paracoccidioides brasiliensis Pb18]
MEAAAKLFFSSPRFAVAGASTDPSKFGYKILAWYHQHSLPVTPLNPWAPEIAFPSHTYSTTPSPSALPSPKQTSLSVVTPPKVTLAVLKEAKSVDIPAVWLQPGTFDDEVLAYARENFKAAVAGMEGSAGHEGWCVLVDGEDALAAAGVTWRAQKL